MTAPTPISGPVPIKYLTMDGTAFDNLEDAEEHQRLLVERRKVMDFVQGYANGIFGEDHRYNSFLAEFFDNLLRNKKAGEVLLGLLSKAIY